MYFSPFPFVIYRITCLSFRIELNWIELTSKSKLTKYYSHTSSKLILSSYENPSRTQNHFQCPFRTIFSVLLFSFPWNFVWIHGTGLKYLWNTRFVIKNVYYSCSQQNNVLKQHVIERVKRSETTLIPKQPPSRRLVVAIRSTDE